MNWLSGQKKAVCCLGHLVVIGKESGKKMGGNWESAGETTAAGPAWQFDDGGQRPVINRELELVVEDDERGGGGQKKGERYNSGKSTTQVHRKATNTGIPQSAAQIRQSFGTNLPQNSVAFRPILTQNKLGFMPQLEHASYLKRSVEGVVYIYFPKALLSSSPLRRVG